MKLVALRGGAADEVLRTAQDAEDFEQEIVDEHAIAMAAAGLTELMGGSPEQVLQSVLDTEISPELVPAGQDGKVQSTEDTIGPYALHDFALFHVLRYGLRPSKIAFLAEQAWSDATAGAWPSSAWPLT